ncbi:MAG: hypothetical protein JNL19_16645 [Burkholderiales bacterium]|nr:hypothetical protein [Burkholderiales bacterium]
MLKKSFFSLATVALWSAALAPNAFAQLGNADKELVYTPMPPCRIVDTRVAGGIIAAGTQRDIDVTAVSSYSFQGGDASNCNGFGTAGSFAAVALNFTVINPNASGTLKAWAFFATEPTDAVAMHFAAGEVRSNSNIIKIDQGASANELSVKPSATTHLTVDVVGYFKAATLPATPTLQCVNTTETNDTVAAGGTMNTLAPACPAGTVQTATNCTTTSWQMPLVYFKDGTCSAQNNSGSSANLKASRTCCRVVP